MLRMLSCQCLGSIEIPGSDDACVISELGQGKSVDHFAELLTTEAEFRNVFPSGPRTHTTQTYGLSKEMLTGPRMMRGRILVLQRQPQSSDGKRFGDDVIEATVAIYADGFSIASGTQVRTWDPEFVPEAEEQCYLWSPFSAVECHSSQAMGQKFNQWGLSVFKLTVLRCRKGVERSFYFATIGPDSAKERTRWMDAMAGAICSVTGSLFPQNGITANPVPGVRSTQTRILAGHLLYLTHDDVVSVVYCELHTYLCGESRLSLYRGEWCDWEIMAIRFVADSVITSRKGDNCTVFTVDRNIFAARTTDERELWLRALGNIKVKLMFDAPDPTDQDLEVMRQSVQEQIVHIADRQCGEVASEINSTQPLLPQLARGPLPASPAGDYDADMVQQDEQPDAVMVSFGGRRVSPKNVQSSNVTAKDAMLPPSPGTREAPQLPQSLATPLFEVPTSCVTTSASALLQTPGEPPKEVLRCFPPKGTVAEECWHAGSDTVGYAFPLLVPTGDTDASYGNVKLRSTPDQECGDCQDMDPVDSRKKNFV